MHLRDEQVIDVFRELPGHRGSTECELDAIEHHFGITLPITYRELMPLDAARLVSSEIVTSPHHLQSIRDDATHILIEDNYSFSLSPSDFVFAWLDIFAFYFFTADGTPDPPVMMFNYYNSDNDWTAVIEYDTLTEYFATGLRRYLAL